MGTVEAEARPIRSLIPARLDRLNWSPFHTRLVCGLGGRGSSTGCRPPRPIPDGEERTIVQLPQHQ